MNRILKLLCLMTFISCTPSEEAEEKGEWHFYNDLKIEADGGTRNLSDQTTLRAMLYSLNLDTEATATYVFLESNPTYLKATDNGIYGFVGNKYLAMVSPALPVVDWNSKIKAVITCPNKTDDAGNDAGTLYATTQLETFDVGEYAAVRFSQPMHEIRSKISFKVRNSATIQTELSVVKITLKGAGQGTPDESLYYFPATRQCMVPPGETDEMLFKAFTERTDANGTYQESATRYILSGIYAPRRITAEILGVSDVNENIMDKQFLNVDMSYKQGEIPQEASLLLNANAAELKPRHNYTFEITIAATKINVVLQIWNQENSNQWQASGNQGTVIGEPDETIQVGSFPIANDTNGNWKQPENDLGQTIDNN